MGEVNFSNTSSSTSFSAMWRDLGAQLELVDDLLDVVAETVEIGLEIGLQDLAIIGSGINQLFQRPREKCCRRRSRKLL